MDVTIFPVLVLNIWLPLGTSVSRTCHNNVNCNPSFTFFCNKDLQRTQAIRSDVEKKKKNGKRVLLNKNTPRVS